jgi:hypothetical protein
VSPRSNALIKRRHDAERTFRDEVWHILDAQQENLDRLTKAVELLAAQTAPQNSKGCCVLL